MNKKISAAEKNTVLEAGRAVQAQQHQLQEAEQQLAQIKKHTETLEQRVMQQDDWLDLLLEQSDALLSGKIPSLEKFPDIHISENQTLPEIKQGDTIEIGENWEQYVANILDYSRLKNLDISSDPFCSLMTPNEQKAFCEQIKSDFYEASPHCDKYDYTIAAVSGVLCGLIDIFFVGTPDTSKLLHWSSKQIDNFVMNIAKSPLVEKYGKSKERWDPLSQMQRVRCSPEEYEQRKVGYAIEFLEKNFGVNYDPSTTNKLGEAACEIFNLTPNNHHLKSLAHAPDFIGLLFSILDQFTGTIHFLDNGRLIVFDPKEPKLEGKNFVAKLFCGFVNWFCHCVSDMAGSSATRKKSPEGGGSGLPMPFYELFQLCNFGNIKINSKEIITIADFSVKLFERGYDLRFGIAMAVPVFINELIVRFLFSMKRHYYNKIAWQECLPIDTEKPCRQPELRRMLTVAHGTLCLCDAGDAAIRSGNPVANPIGFALRLNMIAWGRLALQGLAEARGIYRQKYIDIEAITKAADDDWKKLYAEINQ